MIKFAGTWDFGWNTPIKEIDLWQYQLMDYGFDNFIMTPVSGISNPFVTEYSDLEVVLAEYRNLQYQIVFVDENGTDTLSDFVHPVDNALYIFGRAGFSPYVSYNQPGDKSLKITTKMNNGLLWPHQALTLICADRLAKGV
jgi:hypothetical protein